MSEKTPTKRVETQAEWSERPNGNREQSSWIALLDARIRRAEAAERAIEAWLAWHSGNVDGTWDAFVSAVTEYAAAREAVRKLEEAT